MLHVPGRNGSFLFVMTGTRRFDSWITKDYLGIRNNNPDRDYEFAHMQFELQKISYKPRSRLTDRDKPTG